MLVPSELGQLEQHWMLFSLGKYGEINIFILVGGRVP